MTQINKRVQARYDELMAEGKHGHYETMFRVVHEERALAAKRLYDALSAMMYGWDDDSVRTEAFAALKEAEHSP